MLKEFREFAIKGNVVDMAVGIILGAAFTAIVQSLANDVMMPVLGLMTGGLDFSNHFLLLEEGTSAGPYVTVEAAREAGATVLAWGKLVNAVLSFTMVAGALFFMVKWVNRLRRPDTPPAPHTRPCPFCRSHIDESASRCPHCTSEVEPTVAPETSAEAAAPA